MDLLYTPGITCINVVLMNVLSHMAAIASCANFKRLVNELCQNASGTAPLTRWAGW